MNSCSFDSKENNSNETYLDGKLLEHAEFDEKCWCDEYRFHYNKDSDSLNLTNHSINISFQSELAKLQVDSILTMKIKEKFPEAEFSKLIPSFTKSLKGVHEKRYLSHYVIKHDVNYETNLVIRIREQVNSKRILIDSSSIEPFDNGKLKFDWPTVTFKTKIEVVVKWNTCQTSDSHNELNLKNGEIFISDNNGKGYWVIIEVLKGSKR